MGTAWVVAAIGFGAAVFMLGFLIALLREGAPSACYWVVPVRREPKSQIVEVLSSNSVEDDWREVSGQPAMVAAQGDFPATAPAGIPGRSLRQTGLSGARVFLRLRIGPPWQS